MHSASVSARSLTSPLSLSRSILLGTVGFFIASIIVFATVAFGERWMYRNLGVYGSYACWTVLFIVTGAAALSLLRFPGMSAAAFYVTFGVAFLLYAVGWSAAYFLLGSGAVLFGGLSEWTASLAGSILMGITLAIGLGAVSLAPKLTAILFVANSAGYFLGGAVFYRTHSKGTGMRAWGAIFGLFLGAGLGATLFLAQDSRTKRAQEAAN
jgi:hypothetical protein